MMRSSLIVTINIRIVVAVAICVLLLGTLEFYRAKNAIDADVNSRLSEVSQRLAKTLVLPIWNVDYEVVVAIIETEMEDRDILAIIVTDSLVNNRIISRTRDSQWRVTDMTRDTPLESVRRRKEKLISKEVILGSVEIYFTEKFLMEDLLKTLGNLASRMLLLLILIIGFLVFFITRSVSSPIKEMSKVCEKVAKGDFGLELDVARPDEIGSLANSFMQMRDSVREKIESLNREIRDRKRSENELQRLRNYLANIVDSMPSILVGVDQQGQVVLWNLEAQQVTGISSEEAYGKKLLKLLPFLIDVETELSITDKESSGSEKITRISYLRGDARHLADVTVYPLGNGSVEGAVVRVDNVTDRVKMEEMMVHTEKMMSVAGLAAGMAHEINNPLAGVMQNIQVIQNRLSPGLEKNREVAAEFGFELEDIQAYLKKRDILKMFGQILESGKRAVRIVNNMLSFSRKSTSTYIPCDICEELDKTVELINNDYDLKKKYDLLSIGIVKEYDSKRVDVPCDNVKMQQVFFNLLKNSAQAISKKMELTTQNEDFDPRIEIRVEQETSRVRIEVQDNGIGMEEEVRKRIFEPFYTTQPVGSGMGLGLSVSYFIVKENHGGSIEAVSLPGKGTTITIYLPLISDVLN